MFSVHPTEVNELLEIKIQGHLTKDDIEEFSALLILKTNAEDNVDFLVDFDEWAGTSFSEFIQQFRFKDHLKELNKIALIANDHWIKMDVNVNELLPGIEVKHFQPEEKHIAEAWLAI